MHPSLHFFWTVGLLLLVSAVLTAVRNPLIRRRLFFADLLLVVALGLHGLARALPGVRLLAEHGEHIENLLVAFAVVQTAVALGLNPWRRQGAGERTPAIVQDTVVAVATVIAAMLIFRDSSVVVGITGSAIVVGLALQDTLGNAFAGLAIQIDKPFRVGHWIQTSSFEGRVVEVTWRATRILTKSGNLVVLPNSTVAKEAINNYSEPAIPTRLFVDVGASYAMPPNATREAMLSAMRRVPRVLTTPAPDVLLLDFGGSALTYRARFWIDQFDQDEAIRSDVRSAIYYEFKRRDIEIPFPIQVEYQREPEVVTPEARIAAHQTALASVPMLAALPVEDQCQLAAVAQERLFADGESIVREGDSGASLFVVCAGEVVVTVGIDHREVAVTTVGGFFGEMSLLTGEPRKATVTARGDCRVLELPSEGIRRWVQDHPEVIDQMARSAAERQLGIEAAMARPEARVVAESRSLAQRMREFFGLDSRDDLASPTPSRGESARRPLPADR